MMAEAPKQVVAMRYDPGQEAAPRVIAKGRGPVAERILHLAEQHGILLWEDEDLVKLLGVLELDSEIPPHLYQALAEILAHLYRANRAAEGQQQTAPPMDGTPAS
jgi:flagellar biosynthesis protein